jgi:hypothetical protein
MQESVSDFKARLALLMRQRETGNTYSIIGAPRASECLRRSRNDRPTPSETMMLNKQKQQQQQRKKKP